MNTLLFSEFNNKGLHGNGISSVHQVATKAEPATPGGNLIQDYCDNDSVPLVAAAGTSSGRIIPNYNTPDLIIDASLKRNLPDVLSAI